MRLTMQQRYGVDIFIRRIWMVTKLDVKSGEAYSSVRSVHPNINPQQHPLN